jgi:N utilization substance protein B
LSRRKAREIAFKVLFQVDQVDADARAAFNYLVEQTPLEDNNRDFSWQLVEGCLQSLPEIDEKITKYSREWSLSRMLSVDRNVMRLACYEILHMTETHPVVVIDEAIEIAKRYGNENSGGFVNAILDKILGEKK